MGCILVCCRSVFVVLTLAASLRGCWDRGAWWLRFWVPGGDGRLCLLVGANLPVRALMLVAAQVRILWVGPLVADGVASAEIMLLWDEYCWGPAFGSAGATWLLVSETVFLRGRRFAASAIQNGLFNGAGHVVLLSETSLLGLAANFLVVPVVTLLMVPLGLTGMACLTGSRHYPIACGGCVKAVGIDDGPLMLVLSYCRGWAVIEQPVGWLPFALGIAVVAVWATRRAWAIGLWLMTIALVYFDVSAQGAKALRVSVLDVGQGLAVVIRAGGRTLVMTRATAFSTVLVRPKRC